MANIVFDQVREHDYYTPPIERESKISAILKVVSLFGFLIILGIVLLVRSTGIQGIGQAKVTSRLGSIEYITPYKNTLYENFGYVQDPKLTLPLKTIEGYEDTTFLLDSGAVVSAMPIQAAEITGVDLGQSKRITVQGFSGVPTFAYLDEITVKIGDDDFTFPAVFTESSRTTYILGRKGFFDDFTIEFDHNRRAMVITTKK